MLNVAPLIFARSIACRTASAAVSDPSVPTTIRVNTPPPSLAHRTAPILAAYSGFGRFSLPIFVFMGFDIGRRETAEPEADDFFRRRGELHDRDHHRGHEADDQHDHSDSPGVRHTATLERSVRPIPAGAAPAG